MGPFSPLLPAPIFVKENEPFKIKAKIKIWKKKKMDHIF